eukprot:g19906.t1
MPRHGQNNTASPYFTNEELRKMGYGTKKVRMSGDMMKDFDACHLCLHQAEAPMACTKGHLFCKACIYECLLRQKEYQKTQTVLYEEQLRSEREKQASTEDEEKQKAIERFQKLESGILNPVHTTPIGGATTAAKTNPSSRKLIGYDSVTTNTGDEVFVVDHRVVEKLIATKDSTKLSKEEKEMRLRALPSFWIPSLTPDTVTNKIKPPAQHTGCPAGSHMLKLKNLTPVHFTPVNEGEVRRKGDSTQGKYMCGGCRKTLTNSNKLSLLKKCGHVVCADCMSQLVEKDQRCVECQAKVTFPKGVIKLEGGGRSFAAHGATTASARITPVGNG